MFQIIFSLMGAVVWGALMFGLLYLRQTPRSQVRRRILAMVERAESERARALRARQAAVPSISTNEQQQNLPVRRSFFVRIIKPIIFRMEHFLHSLTPTAIIGLLEMYIFRAGKQGSWALQRAAAMWAISVVLGVAIAFLVLQYRTFLLPQKFLILIVGGLIGAIVPFFILRAKIRNRQKEIKRTLPEFLDLLCVSVQAGLSFDGAVAKITARMKGSLSDEFKHMLDDVKFGMTKQYALNQVAKRCDLEEIYLFTTSVIQAEKLGTSMAQTLQLQADNIRDRHRQHVKTEAMKAPVKMIFPMVLFIFPAMFVVLLMPSIITLLKTMGSQ